MNYEYYLHYLDCDRIIPEPFQGSDEWKELRKTKITSTDARVIMGVDPWKTKRDLFLEKLGNSDPKEANAYMKRGLDLEDGVRSYLSKRDKLDYQPVTCIRDWALASLDGLAIKSQENCLDSTLCFGPRFFFIEIKCPGQKDHAEALAKKIPKKYYPQLQFSMYVTGTGSMCYESSIDGKTTQTVVCIRDDDYIAEMIVKCKEFYDMMQGRKIPDFEDDFVHRDDAMWSEYAELYKDIQKQKYYLEMEEKRIKNHLIYLSMSRNCVGAGIKLQKVKRQGNIDYSQIKELENVDLEKYRKPETESWRITQ